MSFVIEGSMYWRSATVLFSTSLCLGLSAVAFWYQDWQYSLPTERPIDLDQPEIGRKLQIQGIAGGNGVFLHFFNPDCPCSRFNVDHVRSLARRYGRSVRFVAVLQGEGGAERLRKAFLRLGLEMEPVVDETGEIGKAAGVYATPQAVLLDGSGRLYFRGNYNVSRYCTEPATEYARIAIDDFLSGKPARSLPSKVSLAYGCPLSKRKQGAASKL